MQPIISPVDVALIEAELTEEKFVRNTNNGKNLIYSVTYHNSPNLMREIARLREVTFRNAGGGTGKEMDIDTFDTRPNPYQQLVVWNPEYKEVVGGYRYMRCGDADRDPNGNLQLATSGLFDLSAKFVNEILPVTIELGRSFVQPNFQPTAGNRKGLFSLDNIWDGLGAITVDNPDIKYFYGKVTMYRHFNVQARDMILYFLKNYFPDPDHLLRPKQPLPITSDVNYLESLFKGLDYKEGYKVLKHEVGELNEHIPPLVNTYMNLSPTMKSFGTALNSTFGEVEETGILVTIADIYESKKERHLKTYHPKRK
ncbi:MAG: GNAT family N-acetyltransferase [Bacteroidetes bacterium]|nr:GNAT family N-acetyltransferase [Bacteroidota bacterium]MBK9799386.1 GNAT family N-acetyltransferase [Bacteroidota bacterium]